MEICVLASGSSGNCTYVAAGGVRLLIDLGLSLKEAVTRLEAIGRPIDEIDAILCTHAHDDHCRGITSAGRKYNLRLLANGSTADIVERADKAKKAPSWDIFESGATFTLGGLNVTSFSVPHDVDDTVGFIIDDGTHRLGVCTDLGCATALVQRRLAQCDALILEFNHDEEMVMQSDRSWSLKRRITGRHGHLSNESAAELLAKVAAPRLRVVFAAHLSEECNTPLLARNAARVALDSSGCKETHLIITSRHEPTEMVVL